MPEKPLYSKRVPVWRLPDHGKPHRSITAGYAELRCKTNYSFLQGASHPDELAKRAAELGYAALAITDVNSLAGVVRAHVAAEVVKLKLLIGAEITPDDAPAVLLFAPTLPAYRCLSRLITRGRRAAPKGQSRLTFGDIAEHVSELLAAVIPADPDRPNIHDLVRYGEVFRDRCYLAASLHRGCDDDARLDRLVAAGKAARLPLIANNDVHYHVPERRHLHDVVTAIRHGVTVAELGTRRFPNGERHLKACDEMTARFARHRQAIANGLELAARCTFSLNELRYQYPEELCPAGLTPTDYLARLTRDGAKQRYPDGVPPKVTALIKRELTLIAELRYEAYFLTVHDLVKFARESNIMCQGRGSAANSAVCYCLGITSVDPDRTDVLFERFISRERAEAPDIDVDFEHERREEVLQYVFKKYGRDRAAITAEVITYRPRSAVRDVGKALGLSLDRVDRLAKVLDPYAEEDLSVRLREAGLDPESPAANHLVRLSRKLLGFPRHLGQHVGGFVITQGPLSEVVPIENAAMEARTIVQWDKDDLDVLGILKVDCLALGMLTAIHKCFDLVGQHYGRALTLATVPAEDPAVYDMMCRADTVGVFQIESRAQMSMLPRLKPRKFYDLVVEIAIVRPGPIQGGMVHPYLRRRNGQELPAYPNEAVREALHKTLGVPLFQEQVMRLAMVAAGFSAGEADELRRAMGAWRRPGLIGQFRSKLRQGMVARGLPAEFAEQIYEQISGFGEYGFPESHAASFALLAYVSAWLKCYYPAAFTAALLNSQPMGFYAPAQLVGDVRAHGVEVRPVDVNASKWDCTLEGSALRLGFRLINGLSKASAQTIVDTRRAGPFRSVTSFARRTMLGRPVLTRVAGADALASLGLNRREALWHVLSAGNELPLFADIASDDETTPLLAEMPLSEHVVADYRWSGLSLKAHPISLVRPELTALGACPAAKLDRQPDRSNVSVAGLVIVRQRPGTSKGTTFVTVEDETGVVNLVVWANIAKRFRVVMRGATAMLAHGRLERADNVTHVIVNRLEDLSEWLTEIATRSRDFR